MHECLSYIIAEINFTKYTFHFKDIRWIIIIVLGIKINKKVMSHHLPQ